MSEDGSVKKPKTGDVEAFDLVPCVAMCCCIYSLYTEIPDCCGSVCENTFMCCNCKTITCKPSKESGVFCKFFSCDWDFVAATTCCTVSEPRLARHVNANDTQCDVVSLSGLLSGHSHGLSAHWRLPLPRHFVLHHC